MWIFRHENIKVTWDVPQRELNAWRLHHGVSETILVNTLTDVRIQKCHSFPTKIGIYWELSPDKKVTNIHEQRHWQWLKKVFLSAPRMQVCLLFYVRQSPPGLWHLVICLFSHSPPRVLCGGWFSPSIELLRTCLSTIKY